MKTTQRLIRSALQAVVLLGFLGAGGAWGQTASTGLKKFTTDKGCELFIDLRGFNQRNFTWTGECRDGKAWGRGVLTYETYDEYGKRWVPRWTEVGQFDNEGRQSLNWMVVNKTIKIIGFESFKDGVQIGLRFLSQAKKPETLAGAREYLDEWTKGRTEALVPFLLTAATVYFEDRANFYSGDFAKNSSADSFNTNANNSQTNSADDPKVFGRSARGS